MQRDSDRLSRAGKAGARKVGTAQSTILLNRKVRVSVTDSATEKNIPPERVRVKTRGKSSRGGWRHSAGVNLMGCKSKYRGKEAFGLREGCSSVSQGRALEPAGDRRSREMTVAPQGEQNPAYSPESLFYRESCFCGIPLLLYRK